MLNKIIEYGLYSLVFLLPLQTRWIIKAGFTEYQTYSLYGTDILLILLLVLSVIVIASDRRECRSLAIARDKLRNLTDMAINQRLLRRYAPRNDKIIFYLIIGLVLTSAVSVLFAIDKLLALYKLGWLILGLGLFWLMVSANYDRVKLIYALLAGVFLQAGLAIWQFLTQSSFASKWLGLALHNAADLGASVIETVGADGVGERWLRAYGGLDHPNMLGGVMAISILLILCLSLIDAPAKKSPALRVTPLIKGSIIIFAAALFFSFSRGAWLALTLGIGAMLTAAVFKKNLWAQKNILQAVLISGLVGFILFFQFSNLVMTRIYGGERLEVKSANERLESLKSSRPIIKNNWAGGVGLGNYSLALNRQEPGKESFYYQPAHNAFLLVWAETGILEFMFFIGLIIYLIITNLEIRNWKLEIRGSNYENNSSFNISVLVSLIVLLSLDHWLWSLHFGVLFFWLVLGMMAREKEKV